MNEILKEKLNSVNKNWTKDIIIRYLYSCLAPYFRRDTEFFLTSEDEQIKMWDKKIQYPGIDEIQPDVICVSFAKFYQDALFLFDINSELVTVNNNVIPLYGLLVEGDYGWYYINPLVDLVSSQYGGFPINFGNLYKAQEKYVLNSYPHVERLPREYIAELDSDLGINYWDDYLKQLEIEVKDVHKYKTRILGNPNASILQVIDSKIELMSEKLINLGQVNGVIERIQLYRYLFTKIFDRREKASVFSKINEDLSIAIWVEGASQDGKILYSEEPKTDGGYSIKRVNN